MKHKFDKNILGFILNGALHNIISIFMSTFVIAYLLTINSNNFFNVALYYLVSYIVLLISYFLFSHLLTKVNKLLLIRISIILFALILLSMAILKENMNEHVVILAIAYNITNALYYCAINALSNETIRGRKLIGYNTYSEVANNLVAIIIPVIFGSVIDANSLHVVTLFVIAIAIIEVLVTALFDESKIKTPKLNLKGYYNDCYNGNHKTCFKLFFLGYVSYGCKESIATLVTMLIVLTFKTNTSLGIISSFVSLTAILMLLLTKKFKSKNNGRLYLLVTFISLIPMLLLLFDINRINIILFNFAYTALLAVVHRSFSIKRSGLIRAIDKKQYIIEHQAISEIFLNIGRIIFYAILLMASFSNDIVIYKTLLAISMSIVLLYGVCSYLLEKEYNKILIEREFKKQVLPLDNEMEYLIPYYTNNDNS